MTYDLMLNMSKSGIKPRIKVSQYDNIIPSLNISLFDQNQSYTIPSEATVYISGTKKDNTGFKYECTASGSLVSAPITQQMTAFSGEVECEITIVTASGQKSSENFILEVEKSALQDDIIISETDIPLIQRLGTPATTDKLGVVKVDGTSVTIDTDGTLHSSGGGGGAIQSVNGKTGVVVLDADDIDDSNTTNKFTNSTEKTTWNGKSTVSVTQIKSSGEKIATINVNGTDTDLYASAGGGGGGAVDSVNGMTGDVVLTASDVGALADDTPIPSDLSDLSDVDASGVTDGQILKYNATSGKFFPSNESGGGTTDYTDLTNKPSINGVTLSGNKTSGDLGIFAPTITSPTSGQIIMYDGSKWVNGSVSGGSNPNLLDNPWFTINQKGFSSGTVAQTGENVPFIDRWRGLWYSTLASVYNYTSNGLKFTVAPKGSDDFARQGLTQYYSDLSFLSGKVMTISVLLSNGTILSSTTQIGTSSYTSFPTMEVDSELKIIARIYLNSNYFYFGLDNYSNTEKEVTIKALKLELGSQSTLALDTAPNYATELLKCQRYFVRYKVSSQYTSLGLGACTVNDTCHCYLTLPTSMRSTPTASFSGEIRAYKLDTSSYKTISSIGSIKTFGNLISLTFSVSGLVAGEMKYIQSANENTYIDLNAEL